MWRNIEQRILQVRKATGIEIIILEDDKYMFNASTARAKNNSIVRGEEINGLQQFDELAQKLDKKIPVSIVINGKGVLIKKTTASNKGVFQSVLPNANPNDFYFESFVQKRDEIVSIIRKETVEKLLELFKKRGFRVIAVSPGFSVLSNILPFLKANQHTRLESDSLLLETDSDNQVVDFKNKEQVNTNKYQASEYLVANQYIKPANLLSFAAVAGILTDDIKTGSPINSPILSAERQEYRYYKLFKTFGWSFLVFLISILLVSFLFYNKYFSRNRTMADSRILSVQHDQEIKNLENKIRLKERFLEQSGWIAPGRISFFADRIAAVIPGDVLLTSLQVYPARSNSFTEINNHLFKKDTISAGGVCDDPVVLNQFMNNLKLLPEFKEVSIRSYVVKRDDAKGLFSMEIITQ